MTLNKFYQSIFANKDTVITSYIEASAKKISEAASYLPQVLTIKDNQSDDIFKIDFTTDTSISSEEFHILFSQLVQYNIHNEETYTIFGEARNGEKYLLKDLFQQFPGVHGLFKAVLFLDFYNAADFMAALRLHDLIPFVKFYTLPTSEKKEFFMTQKQDFLKKRIGFQTDYDLLNVEYADYSDKIDKLDIVIEEITNAMFKIKQDLSPSNNPNTGKAEIAAVKTRKVKLDRILIKSEEVIERDKRLLISDVTGKGKLTDADHRLGKIYNTRIAKAEKMVKYVASENSILIAKLEESARHNLNDAAVGGELQEYEVKFANLKIKREKFDSHRKGLLVNINNVKDTINNITIEVANIDKQIQSDCKPVDIEKVACENIVLLDEDVTKNEKILRFFISFFSAVDSSAYFDLQDRRRFITALFSDIKVKSLNCDKKVRDEFQFIQVV